MRRVAKLVMGNVKWCEHKFGSLKATPYNHPKLQETRKALGLKVDNDRVTQRMKKARKRSPMELEAMREDFESGLSYRKLLLFYGISFYRLQDCAQRNHWKRPEAHTE